MEYHLAIKKNEILSSVAQWIEPESCVVRETSQTQKDKYSMFSFVWES